MVGLTYLETPIGRLRIEANEALITRIHFEDADTLLIIESSYHINEVASMQLQEYFAGSRKTFDFPFQQVGTEFQHRVWNKLLDISCGKTISYVQLARQLNDEKCIRAAASANGKNDLAIVVPCHRVIGSNGKLVGYAGGIWRKKWLLEHEVKMSGTHIQASFDF
jgi:methylated-DNA-[protein]-cysteine S-methyltransferase